MSEEIKYCKFCGEEKPIKDFCKSGFAIKNKCKQCANNYQKEKYRNAKRVEQLEQVLDEIREYINEKERDGTLWTVESTDKIKQILNRLKDGC